jgi:hypothetical protein
MEKSQSLQVWHILWIEKSQAQHSVGGKITISSSLAHFVDGKISSSTFCRWKNLKLFKLGTFSR